MKKLNDRKKTGLQTYKKMDKEDFMENISDFDSRFELLFCIEHFVAHYAQWLVAVLLQGKKKEPRKINSLICKIQIIFSGFENDLFSNMFDIDFLHDFNGKIHYHLKQLFDMTKKVFVYFSTKICVQYTKLVFR